MIEKEAIPIKIFWRLIDDAFRTVFPKKLISTLSNMLAIDFALNDNDNLSNLSPESKALFCIDNIKSYLELSKERFDESFKSATLLFSIALTPPKNDNYIKATENIESIIDSPPSMHLIESLVHNLANDQISEKRKNYIKVDANRGSNLGRSM